MFSEQNHMDNLKVETSLYETSAPVYDHSYNTEMFFLSGLDLI